jgi:chromosomal replication initiation ATPase DnaA
MYGTAFGTTRVGLSEAGKRIHEAGLRYQRENPHSDETRAEKRARLEAEAAQAARRRAEALEAERVAAAAALAAQRLAATEAATRAAREATIAARIQAILEGGCPAPVKVSEVVQAVCLHFRITRAAIDSHRRTRPLVRPRQVAYFLAKELTTASLPEIGRRIGGKDHTSVLAGARRIASLIEAGDPIAKDVRAIRAMLTGSEEPGA